MADTNALDPESDLTNEQIDGMEQWDRDVMLAPEHRAVGAMLVRRAVREIRRHRTAQAASKEHVRQVVLPALQRAQAIARLGSWGCLEESVETIVDRVAEQLAAPALSAGDLAILRTLRDDAPTPEHDGPCTCCDRRRATLALLDRLLGASK